MKIFLVNFHFLLISAQHSTQDIIPRLATIGSAFLHENHNEDRQILVRKKFASEQRIGPYSDLGFHFPLFQLSYSEKLVSIAECKKLQYPQIRPSIER